MLVLTASVALAFILGFTAQRADICMVAAVADVLNQKRIRSFITFFKIVLWIVLINSIAALLDPGMVTAYAQPSFSPYTVFGGLLFGIGAGINKGCSFSTISKLAQGNLHFGLTLPAFVTGAYLSTRITWPNIGMEARLFALGFDEIPQPLVVVLAIWASYELFRLLRRSLRSGFTRSFIAQRYSLSATAAVIGIASGVLYILHGRWAYAARILDWVGAPSQQHTLQTATLILLSAVLAGAVASAILSGRIRISFSSGGWANNFSGGILMGLGAMLVPGDNARLILHDLPHLSLQALIAFTAMVVGIAMSLMLGMRGKG